MKKTGWIVLSLAGLLTACNGDNRKAAGLLERANASFAAGDYNLAKLQIDSIRTFYPKAFDARKEGIRLMQRVDLEEQQKSLVYLDSMMAVKQAALDTLKPRFVLEKDTAYQDTGNYFYPTQIVEKNIGRSFLRAQVNELGEMSLTSIYCAGGNIHHTAVRVSVGDTYAETPVSNDSYETTDLGRAIEKADYKVGNDGGVVNFILANQDKRNIQLTFLGDRTYRTVMQPNDVKAVVELVELAKVLSGMEEIKKEQNEANLKIRFVERKMQENQEASED